MVTVREQEAPDELLGGRQVAFAEQPRRADDVLGHRLELVAVRDRHLAGFFLPHHPVEALEHAPGGGQGRVDVHRPLVGLNGAWGVLQGDEAVTALLVEQARGRVVALQDLEGRKRLRDAARLTQAKGEQIEHITVLGDGLTQGRGGRDGLDEAVFLEQSANALDCLFDGGQCPCVGRHVDPEQ